LTVWIAPTCVEKVLSTSPLEEGRLIDALAARKIKVTIGLDLAAGIASAIPGVLSLLSAHRSVMGAPTDANHTTAAVAGALAPNGPWLSSLYGSLS
jgi:hypothetical protein